MKPHQSILARILLALALAVSPATLRAQAPEGDNNTPRTEPATPPPDMPMEVHSPNNAAPAAPGQEINAPDVQPAHDDAPAPDAAPTPDDATAPKVDPAQDPATPDLPALKPGLTGTNGVNELRLNFRNAPLDLVLNYLSDAAGFIIVLETPVKGSVDVWSKNPLNKAEAVDLLNTVLNKNGYAAIQNGRTLTITTRDEARKKNIPVKVGNVPKDIPKSDEMITQIIPVRYINATQVVKDLTPLLPTAATLTANEAGNALVITDVQANIRRMAEIIDALDNSVSSTLTVHVFPLRYADAKSVAAVVKELFAVDTSRTAGGAQGNAQRFNPFGGGGPFGGRGGGGAAAAASTGTGGVSAAKVTAVAEERSNSLVVSASEQNMATISDLVKMVDTDVEDLMELKVFRLKYADPSEMADLLTSLFPDETKTTTSNNNMGGFRFGPGGGGNNAAANSASSDRLKKQSRVLAIADQRTTSIVVSASRYLMANIGQMIEQLDSNPAKKQKVFVYSLENAEVQQVETVLQNLFEGQNSRNTRSSSQNSALTTRSTQSQNQSSSSSFGNNSSTRRSGSGN